MVLMLLGLVLSACSAPYEGAGGASDPSGVYGAVMDGDVASGIQRALSDHAGALDENQLAAMASALESARAAAGGGDDPGAAMEAVAEELDALAQELPPGSEAAEALGQLALEAEVLGTGEEPETDGGAVPEGGEGEPAAPDGATAAEGDGAAELLEGRQSVRPAAGVAAVRGRAGAVGAGEGGHPGRVARAPLRARGVPPDQYHHPKQ